MTSIYKICISAPRGAPYHSPFSPYIFLYAAARRRCSQRICRGSNPTDTWYIGSIVRHWTGPLTRLALTRVQGGLASKQSAGYMQLCVYRRYRLHIQSRTDSLFWSCSLVCECLYAASSAMFPWTVLIRCVCVRTMFRERLLARKVSRWAQGVMQVHQQPDVLLDDGVAQSAKMSGWSQ
jgi:hypothetical protein